MGSSSQGLIEPCSKCGQVPNPSEAIYLWDGQPYCAGCVSKASPELLEYARAHPEYEESFQLRQRRPFRLWCKYQIITVAVLLTAVAFAMREPLLLVPFLVICVALWFAVDVIVPNRLRSWEISIIGGDVIAKELGNLVPVQNRLEESYWQIADAKEATGWLLYELPHQRAILMTLGPLKTPWFDAPAMKIPCGLSPDKFEVLAAFLTLSGTPKASTHGSAGAS